MIHQYFSHSRCDDDDVLNYTLTKLSEATVRGGGGKFASSSSSSSPRPHIYERGPGTYSVSSCYHEDDRLCGDSSVGSSDEWVDIETDAEADGGEGASGSLATAAAAAAATERNVSFAR